MPWDGVERRNFKPFCQEHDSMIEKVNEVHNAIYGNGNPKRGLYWLVNKNSDFIRTCERILWPVVTMGICGSMAAIANFILNH